MRAQELQGKMARDILNDRTSSRAARDLAANTLNRITARKNLGKTNLNAAKTIVQSKSENSHAQKLAQSILKS